MTLRERWIAALRSGQYIQGRHQLRKNDTFCCLGVLCDLYDKSGWRLSSYPSEKVQWRNDEMGFSRHAAYDGGTGLYGSDLPPPALLRLVGISRENANALIRANDNLKLSFKEIADIIEDWG